MAQATSKIAIANLALGRIGQSPLLSLADGTPTANVVDQNFDPSRLAMLRAYPWGFAKKRVLLPALEDAPVWGWDYAYQLPTDHVWTVQIGEDPDNEPKWVIEGRTLVTNEPAPLQMLYIRDEEDPTKFDPLFIDALADQLAAEISFSITKDIKYRGAFLQTALFKAQSGRTRDSQEGSTEALYGDALITVRNAGAR